MLRVRRKENGTLLVSMDAQSAELLKELPQRMRSALERPDFTDRVVRRLFPPAYRTQEKENEYRQLLGDDLKKRKLDSVATFEKTLRGWKSGVLQTQIEVTPEDFELWLGFVNDMRLVLGTELDIRDESWGEKFDPDHPRAMDMMLLHYLSWLEEELLKALP
jgi:hypothetical protein